MTTTTERKRVSLGTITSIGASERRGKDGIEAVGSCVVTSEGHGLANGERIEIEGSDCVPSIDGIRAVQPLTPDTFKVGCAVDTTGTSGSWKPSPHPRGKPKPVKIQ